MLDEHSSVVDAISIFWGFSAGLLEPAQQWKSFELDSGLKAIIQPSESRPACISILLDRPYEVGEYKDRLIVAFKMMCVLTGGDPLNQTGHVSASEQSTTGYTLAIIEAGLNNAFVKRGLLVGNLENYIRTLNIAVKAGNKIDLIKSGKLADRGRLRELESFCAEVRSLKYGARGDFIDQLLCQLDSECEVVTATKAPTSETDCPVTFVGGLELFEIVDFSGGHIALGEARIRGSRTKNVKCLNCGEVAKLRCSSKTGRYYVKCYHTGCGMLFMEKHSDAGATEYPVTDNKGRPVANRIENTRALLAQHGFDIRYNLITHTAITRREGELIQNDDLAMALVRTIADTEGFSISQDRVRDHMLIVCMERRYNPVLDWLGEDIWDGIDRFPALLASLKINGACLPIYATMLRKWCRQTAKALVAVEGDKFENVLVLEGKQGGYKTTWIKSLSPICVKEGLCLNTADKDSLIAATGAWIIELGELDATFRKSDISRLKGFLSQSTDEIRRPFARSAAPVQRTVSFAATVNETQFLQDRTGNRRFLVVPVTECDPNHGVDMRQFWLQMLDEIASGQLHYLTKEEEAEAAKINEKFTASTVLEDAVTSTLEASDTETPYTVINAHIAAMGLSSEDRRSVELSRILRRLYGEPRKSNGHVLFRCRIAYPVSNFPAIPSYPTNASEQ